MTDIQNGKMIDPGKKSWNIKAGVFSSCMLHIIAMACMLRSHVGNVVSVCGYTYVHRKNSISDICLHDS